jgi:phage-related protein
MASKTELDIVINAKDEASAKIKGIGVNLKDLGLGMAAAGTVITGALGLAVNAAADAEKKMAVVNATLASMGKAGEDAKGALLTAADATLKLGFDNEEAAQSLAKFFQRTKDVNEATQLNAVAMDLARAKNIDLSSASTLVGQVLAGNGKVLKQYGIDIKDSATPLQALGELQKKVGGQAEAFSKTFAGSSEAVKQQMGELQEKIGAMLLPMLAKLVSHLVPIIEKVMAWMDQNPKLTETIVTVAAVLGPLLVVLPALVAAIAAIASPVGLAIAAFALLVAAGVAIYQNWDTIKAKAIEIWNGIHDYLKGKLAGMGIDMDKWMSTIKEAWSAFWSILKLEFGIFIDIFTGNWSGAWTKMKQIVDIASPILKGALSAVWASVVSNASAAFDGLKNTVRNAVNWVIDRANSMISAINNAASAAASKVGLSAPQIPTIPALASGGIVTRPTLALIGEAGPEAVVPLSGGNNGFGGATINISIGNFFGGDPEVAARDLGDLIIKRLQANARI